MPFADGRGADLEFERDSFLVEFISGEEFGAFVAAFLELCFGESSGFPGRDLMILEVITPKMPISVNCILS